MWLVLAAVFFWVGGVMMFRGWNYSLHPDGPRAQKRKAKNLELGFPTDMKMFGRKVRRLGTIMVLVGVGFAALGQWSRGADVPQAEYPSG